MKQQMMRSGHRELRRRRKRKKNQSVRGFNGVLCAVCREMNDSEFDSYKFSTHKKSGGKWVTVPFTFWGDFLSSAKKHEFGSKYEKCNMAEILDLRKKIDKGTAWTPDSLHMKVHLRKFTLQTAEASKSTVSYSLLKSAPVTLSRMEKKQKAFLQTFAILHCIIKRADSPFSSFKDAILFQRDDNQLFSKVLQHISDGKERGLSARRIEEMIDCLYIIIILGIYMEMCGGLAPEEPIVFGSSIDTGTKTKKTKNYAGVGVKYFSQ